jgi:outer membrane receptor protein involved in Fe transport
VKQNKTTYLASLRYKPTDGIAIYGRIATGYRPGGPSALPAGIIPDGKQSFDPDSLTSYELGLKSQFADGRASLEAALFTTDWKDIQIQTSTQTPAGTFQYFVNGGTARSRGAEATLTWLPARGLTLRLTSAYTDSKLTEDAPAVGGVKGDPMPFVPKVTASAGLDYELSPIGDWQPFFGATYGYIDSRRSNFTGKNPFTVPSYELVNVNLGVDFRDFRVSLYGKNLTDSRGINFLNGVGLALPGINPLGNPYAAGVVAPRTLGVELSARF